MKKLVKGGILTVIALCLFSGVVDARNYYTNEVGVEMTELEYNKMLKIYPAKYLMYISQEEFDSLKDVNIIANDTIYYKSIYGNGQVISEGEISKEEYEKAPSSNSSPSEEIIPLSGDNDYVETSYKKLTGTVAESMTGNYQLIGSLDWKKVPVTRSFDVFAFRLNHFNYSGFAGSQMYFYETGNHGIVKYDTSSPGYKSLDNGAGVSMNLVDGTTITGYNLTITATLTKNAPANISQGHVYVSYQHAQSDLTRALSMDYHLSITGLGNVIYFNNSTTASKYDAMGGIHMVPTFN